MDNFLKATEIIDYDHPKVLAKAKELANGCDSDEEITKVCFEFVRDKIHHSGDFQESPTTLKASEVLKYGTGWCYAKTHLLAALLRANGIPTALMYQRLNCSEYEDGSYCLHGLNGVYLKSHGWYRVDPRGNKAGVDAQFTPPVEKLAFKIGVNEFDLHERYSEPITEIIEALLTHKTYEEMAKNIPDIKSDE